jgi:hypothetical protein
MSSHKIEKLLVKYFEGETSLAEERTLREFFLKENIPAHLLELREQFGLFESEAKEELPDDFDEKLFDEIDNQERSKKTGRRMTIYYISSVAATILILITVFVRFDTFRSDPVYNDRDAEIAFNEASRILYFVSDKFNKGAGPLGKVARFDQGVNNLKPVKKFDEGVNKVTPVSTFNQITKLITNPAQ